MQPRDEEVTRGRVLVVDDKQDMCFVLSKILSERGHEVQTARTAANALKAALSDFSFDCQVAIVDYRLPDSNGLALIIGMTARLPRLKSILMTSFGSESLCQDAIEERVFAYFDKPFNNDLMIRTVEDAIREWETGDDSLATGVPARTRFPGRAPSKPWS